MNGDFLTSIASKLYALSLPFSNATASCFRLFQAISPDLYVAASLAASFALQPANKL